MLESQANTSPPKHIYFNVLLVILVIIIFLQSIQQHLILLPSGEDKDNELINLIQSRFRGRSLVLIFVARKNTCDFVTNMLCRVGEYSFASFINRAVSSQIGIGVADKIFVHFGPDFAIKNLPPTPVTEFDF